MSVTLSQLLELTGRLEDDSLGFDTPRERFRRFLTHTVVDVQTARTLIEQGQRLMIGEQQHRALQDAVVALGRFLGFETTFGTYRRTSGTMKYDGDWRSRHRLHVVLDIRTDLTPRTGFDDLSRSRSLAPKPFPENDAPLLGLCVVTPLSAARGWLYDTRLGDKRNHDWRVASVGSLLWLAEKVTSGQLTHDDVVKLLSSSVALDFVVELLDRFDGRAANGSADAVALNTPEPNQDFWAATVERGEAATFQKMIESAVGDRRVLGVAEKGASSGVARPGDWICFFAPGKGVVGQARVSAVAGGEAGLVRRSDRFSRLYRLTNVEVFDTPIIAEPETERTLVEAHEQSGVSGPMLVPLSRHKFTVLTKQRPAGPHSEAVLQPKPTPRASGGWSETTGRVSGAGAWARASGRTRFHDAHQAPGGGTRFRGLPPVLTDKPAEYLPPASRRSTRAPTARR
jgi:hypothetical protein